MVVKVTEVRPIRVVREQFLDLEDHLRGDRNASIGTFVCFFTMAIGTENLSEIRLTLAAGGMI